MVRELDGVLTWPRLSHDGACLVPALGNWVLDVDMLVYGQSRQLPGTAVIAGLSVLVLLGGTVVTLLCVRLLSWLVSSGVSRYARVEGVAVDYLRWRMAHAVGRVSHLQQSASKHLTQDGAIGSCLQDEVFYGLH